MEKRNFVPAIFVFILCAFIASAAFAGDDRGRVSPPRTGCLEFTIEYTDFFLPLTDTFVAEYELAAVGHNSYSLTSVVASPPGGGPPVYCGGVCQMAGAVLVCPHTCTQGDPSNPALGYANVYNNMTKLQCQKGSACCTGTYWSVVTLEGSSTGASGAIGPENSPGYFPWSQHGTVKSVACPK